MYRFKVARIGLSSRVFFIFALSLFNAFPVCAENNLSDANKEVGGNTAGAITIPDFDSDDELSRRRDSVDVKRRDAESPLDPRAKKTGQNRTGPVRSLAGENDMGLGQGDTLVTGIGTDAGSTTGISGTGSAR